ncbi:serine/threonine-protein kinase [Nocardiopsis sp. N85]|uniref:WD40 repeat domain-containing serine/threonine protein kinase n=1 Tax=Nocardiopsis sp. N85 TaxID=3029400 RepID=UPI00237FAF13|nr:serine/threonine-protein kinase [Nocardiopsis sp. N85]MDE3723062.1 serine/threonine-protein kinase [Nocardiopsis sp. N85]
MHPLTPDDPRSVGPHRLLARLGAGGMGKVYLARTPGGDLAALKLVKDELAHDPEFRARFSREVRAAGRVRGPFTPAVVDADTEADVPWMATEYVPGPTLKEAVREHGPLPAASLPVLVSGLARALAAVHDAGLTHRDLKPGNVLLSPRGPQVIDFGIARAVEGTVLTRTGQNFGTPAYASPEQITGRDVSSGSDVFSLAGTAVFAAGGAPPFGTGRPGEVLRRITSGEPDLGAVPEGPLRDLLTRCLAKDPAGRPDTVGILAALTDVPVPSTEHEWLPAPVTEKVRRLREHEADARGSPAGEDRWRRPALTAGAAAAALLLVGGGGYALTALPGGEASNTDAGSGTGDGGSGGAGREETEGGVPNDAFASTEVDPDLWLADEVTFSPDGERMYVTGVTSFSVWDWRAGEMVGHLNPTPGGTDVNPEGSIAAAHGDRVEILDDDGAVLVTTLTSNDPDVSHLRAPAVSPDGARAAALGVRNEDFENGNVLVVWDVETGEVVRDVSLEGPFSRLEYTADGGHLVARLTSHDGETLLGIAVWDVGTGEWAHYFEGLGDMVFGLHPTDPSLMALRDDGSVRLIDLRSGGTIRSMDPVGEDHDEVAALVFSPDGERLYAGVDEPIEHDEPMGTVWDVASGAKIRDGDVLLPAPLGVHPDWETVAAVDTEERHILILDGDDLTVIDELS